MVHVGFTSTNLPFEDGFNPGLPHGHHLVKILHLAGQDLASHVAPMVVHSPWKTWGFYQRKQ